MTSIRRPQWACLNEAVSVRLSLKAFGRLVKSIVSTFLAKNPANFEEPSKTWKMCLRNQRPLFSCLPYLRFLGPYPLKSLCRVLSCPSYTCFGYWRRWWWPHCQHLRMVIIINLSYQVPHHSASLRCSFPLEFTMALDLDSGVRVNATFRNEMMSCPFIFHSTNLNCYLEL